MTAVRVTDVIPRAQTAGPVNYLGSENGQDGQGVDVAPIIAALATHRPQRIAGSGGAFVRVQLGVPTPLCIGDK